MTDCNVLKFCFDVKIFFHFAVGLECQVEVETRKQFKFITSLSTNAEYIQGVSCLTVELNNWNVSACELVFE